MKIEINTNEMSKDELLHLSNMLLALSGQSRAQTPSTSYNSSDVVEGFGAMFGDQSPSAPVEPQPAQQSGDMFSLFADDTKREEPKREPTERIQIIEY